VKKAYLLVFSDEFGTREQVKQWLNEMPEIITWRYDMPHSFYVISENTAAEIANPLHDRSGKGRFLVSEITANKWGWLPQATWYLLDQKEHKPTPKAK